MAERQPRRAVVGFAAVGLALAIGLGSASASAAPGRDADPAEVVELARAAVDDDAALAELRRIDEVDGRKVDLAAATTDLGDGPERARRLEAIAALFDEPGSDTDRRIDPQAEARDVLAGDAYQPADPPRPFRGLVRWVGERLEPVLRVLGTVFGPLWRAIEAVPFLGFVLLAAAVALVARWAVRVAARRSRPADGQGRGRLLVNPDADPVALEAEADAAEAAGDLGLALRRRYEAGLVRLVRSGRLVLQPDTTPGRAAAEVGGEPMAALTRAFEEVVYGGRAATADDLALARQGWPQVLDARPVR